MSELRRVEREVVLAATPEEVWSALTEADHLSSWFGANVVLEARPGGAAEFRWPDGVVRAARVEGFDPPRRFTLRWMDVAGGEGAGSGEPPRVSFYLEPAEEGTRLTVVESTSFGPSPFGPRSRTRSSLAASA